MTVPLQLTYTLKPVAHLQREKVYDETNVCSTKTILVSLVKRHQTGAGVPVRQETCIDLSALRLLLQLHSVLLRNVRLAEKQF